MRKGFLDCTGCKADENQSPDGLLRRSTGRFTILRLHKREWCAVMLRTYEIASSQLDSSLCRFSPISLAIADFSGNWCDIFLYSLDKVLIDAISSIFHASASSAGNRCF